MALKDNLDNSSLKKLIGAKVQFVYRFSPTSLSKFLQDEGHKATWCCSKLRIKKDDLSTLLPNRNINDNVRMIYLLLIQPILFIYVISLQLFLDEQTTVPPKHNDNPIMPNIDLKFANTNYTKSDAPDAVPFKETVVGRADLYVVRNTIR